MLNIYKLFLFFIFVTYLKAGEINFTPQETQFIEQNPNITIAFMGDYTPMSYVENNKFTGYSNDLLILLEKKTGLKFEKQIDAWTNNLAKFNNRQVDVIADISYKKERENTTLFTKSYLEVPTVIFVRSDFKEYKGLQSLKGKKIGIQQDVFYEQELRNLGFDIVEFTNYEEQTKALSYGKIDVLIENLATIDYIIKQNNLVNITPVDELEINGIGKEDLRYGIVPNKPILHSIIQKGLDSITDYEKNILINKWIGIDFYKINQNKVHLTDEEMEYLGSNTISVAFLSDFAPFSFYENQIIKGYTVDLFNLISNKLNIKFTKVIGKWSDNLNKFKNNHIDVITDISYIKERENFTAFTTPYFEVPTVIFTRDDFGTYHDLDSLKGKRIGILKDIFYSDKLKNLKDREIVEYTKYEDLTKALSYGKIDAVIQSLATINYFTKKNNITNLKIVDEFHFDGIGKEDVRFGVNPENKILYSILQKGLNAISDEDKAFLITKWIGSNFNKYENNIDLTQEERDYLATKGVIKVCVDPNWMPIERINENGIHEGIASDFLSLISKRANIKLELYKTVTWTESLEATHDGKCDILSFLNTTDDRTKWLNFTKVIHEEPRVFITRGEHEFIIDAKLIKNKTIALPKDYSTVEIIRNIYPNLKIILVDSELEALRLVSEGKADMTLNTLNVSAYTIKKEGFFNLKVAGQMSNIPNTFSIGVIKKEGEVLVNILNKAIDTISSAEKEEIINKYVSIDIKQGIDYAIFWKIFIIVTLVVLSVFGILLYRNRLLNLYNTKLTKAKIDLENEVGQKELLLKELNHRVKNNLQIISGIVSLQSSKKDTSSVLEEIENNISTISVAYDLLTQKEYTGKIELKHYLETLLDSIIPIQTFTIQRYVMSKEVYLDIHDAVNIGLIVTECINNAVKYAFCEQESNHTIIISIEEDDTNITINFSDNGRGFNDLDNKGLGLELIRTLCNNKLKTKPIFYNNNGANVKILIVK